ncbi:MAG: carboxynorspermidine decarboxylase, partial [Desulfomonilia bacterium]|nr:carboxynorspermidine decarboxylase [Desulfomonilia bacterium]
MMQSLPPHLVAALFTIPTPAYVVDMAALKRNMATAEHIRTHAGCRILLATKAFALPAVFPLMRTSLDGTTASGIHEARLGREEFGSQVHVFSPAYTEDTLAELLLICDHIYFNSVAQIRRFLPAVTAAGPDRKVGIRINPGYSRATLGGNL